MHGVRKQVIILSTCENIDSRNAGILLTEMPATVPDAVWVCWKLSIQYLWIDAFCILQFDSDDFEIEAP
jgi:Heterokaryon incompatibility protein (HET)